MSNRIIPALRLKQWLGSWDEFDFDADELRKKPEPYLYMFTMSAMKLRKLSDVFRRERVSQKDEGEGIQRALEERRTSRIKDFIKAGYPYCTLRENLRKKNESLRKPGWLPTAIVVNILTSADQRRDRKVKDQHKVELKETDDRFEICLPDVDGFTDDDLRPFEVIDGQHRLWSFDEGDELSDFEVPVVAFLGLDVSWQAYLFWSINISPVRINPSHAFDLYPLLRNQDWLEKTGEINVYREARAQEITEWLYRHQYSPWYHRISMLQRKGEPRVSQAAWVRSLISTFFSYGRGRGRKGLFQCPHENYSRVLDWERVQQIAFIMEFWVILKSEIEESDHNWIQLYREHEQDPFTDKSSMLNQDMGVRAVHAFLNDYFFKNSCEWSLMKWNFSAEEKISTTAEDISEAISSLKECDFYQHLRHTASAISRFDWRSLDGPEVKSSADEMTKRAYRGSGGYTLLTESVMRHAIDYGKSRGRDDAIIRSHRFV